MSDLNNLVTNMKEENIVDFSKNTHNLLYIKVAKGLNDLTSTIAKGISENKQVLDDEILNDEKDLSPEQKAYKKLYDYTLAKYDSDAKSPNDLSDEEKKKFFNELKKEWAKHPDNKPEKKE